MTDPHATAQLHKGQQGDFHLVYFEDLGLWYIRYDDRNSNRQCWSASGYDSRADAALAWSSKTINYTEKAPGQ